MNELGWRVGLLGAALLLALVWLASALRRAPKRRSRWERLQDETGPIVFPHFLGGEEQRESHPGEDAQGDGDSAGGEPAGDDFSGGDAGSDGGGGTSD